MSEDTNDLTQVKHYSVREIWQRSAPLLRRHTTKLIIAASLVGLVGFAVSLGPLLTKYIIDVALPRKDMRLALFAVLLFLGTQIVRMVAWYVSQIFVLWIREDVVFQLRSQGFRHLQRLCMRFHNRYPSGFLHDRVFERSICGIGVFLGALFTNLTVYASGLIFALAACLYLSVPMTLVILVGACGYVVFTRYMADPIRKSYLEATDAHNWIHSYILDRIRGTKTIQAFALEDRVQADFDRQIWPVMLKWISAQRESMKLSFLGEGLGYLITATIHVLGAYAVFNWDMRVGTLVAFIGYQAQFISFVSALSNMYGTFAMARSGFDQFYTIMDQQSTVADKPGAKMPESIRGELELRHVTFAYDRKPVVRDLCVTVPCGQSVALVGRSGSGKTTITNLLLRFFDPDEGQVLLDGADVRDLPLRDYRALYGVVLQDAFFFNDTIAANLRCVAPKATEKEIETVLRRACAYDFVKEFPNGLQHRVGEGGSQLSGGQRQRLAIARCMLLQPRFLVLDEATSALDNEAEDLVQRALEELFRDHTSFVIAHRLSTIRRVDRILVIDDGQIAEEGTYKELLARRGLFHYLHNIAISTSTRELKMEEAGFA